VVSPFLVALPTLWDCSLLVLSAAPRATLLLEEEPIGCATLCEELLELVAEELLAVVAELLEEEPLLT
jgi:hypothetical protein